MQCIYKRITQSLSRTKLVAKTIQNDKPLQINNYCINSTVLCFCIHNKTGTSICPLNVHPSSIHAHTSFCTTMKFGTMHDDLLSVLGGTVAPCSLRSTSWYRDTTSTKVLPHGTSSRQLKQHCSMHHLNDCI